MGLPHHSGRIDERYVDGTPHPEGVNVPAGGEQERPFPLVSAEKPPEARSDPHRQPKGAEAPSA